MFLLKVKESLLHLLFPHLCEGCGLSGLTADEYLCLQCYLKLPETLFFNYNNNPVERIFFGRLKIENSGALFYFTKGSLIQKLMHEFKYKRNEELGYFLGRIMGNSIKSSNRFTEIEFVIPVPLHAKKQQKRGFNQAAILARAIGKVLNVPVIENAITKNQDSGSQTKKNRMERWLNVEGKYEIVNTEILKGKNILLIDDVITTGATIESCGKTLLSINGLTLNIAALCFASGN
jgi:ComF family protein